MLLAAAQASAALSADDIADLSLEQLSDIVVTSVSRKETRLSAAPASLFIISSADIARSGARGLPDVLRLAPNLQVARVDARNYAITARGFNSVFANKLLVLVDGRSVYSPLFSGVFWDAQDVLVTDIARIEVISGPGATIWGANAVNGVINIITKSAADTQGGRARLTAGEHERSATVRYGGPLGAGGHYRAYVKAVENDDSINAAGTRLPTGLRRHQGGFRADWGGDGGGVTLSGDAYQGKLAQANTRDIAIEGANLMARYLTKPSARSDLRLQLVADHTSRDQPNAFHERLNTLELEVQHGIHFDGGHRVVWGGGYRQSWDRLENGAAFGFLPAALNMHWRNLFAQDEIELGAQLRLTAGLKIEQNNYTGAEKLPNLRLAWTPSEQQLLWSSLSRTVRAPSRIDRDFYSPSAPPVVGGVARFNVAGGPDFESEVANVAEIGYRTQPTPELSYSITAYYSDYDKLRTLEPRAVGGAVFRNLGQGRARGLEMWTRLQLMPSWRLNGGMVVQSVRTGLKAGSMDSSGGSGIATNDPGMHAMLRSSHDLGDSMQFDATLRHVGSLPRPAVPSYRELDLRFMWSPRKDLELSVVGQNLLHRSHAEFGAAPGRSVFERSVVVSASQRF